VQRRTRDNARSQSQYCGTVSHSLRSRQRRRCTPKTRIVRGAYDAATMLDTFASPMHTSFASRLAPRSPLQSHQKLARTDTRRDKHHPPQRHVGVMARVTHHSAHLRATHATHTRTQHTNTQAPRARTTSRTAPTTAHRNYHCTHTAACTPHTARHTAPTASHIAHRKTHPVTHAASAPHSPQSCQAAQRRRDAAGELVAVQPQHAAGHANSHRVTP
jgi:hypothetical protein